MSDGTANQEQIEYWNEVAGPKWVQQQETLDAQIVPLGLTMLDRANIAPGETVLDIGCGCGSTTLEIARRVGPEGRVTGLDISEPMLAHATQRAQDAGLDNITFARGDAQIEALDAAAYDLATSRFGLMFFADPTAAFKNIRTALKPEGRLAFICWRPLKENEWMLIPIAAAAQHIELPPPPEPDTPGPFAFADDARLRGILEDSGFADVAIEPNDADMVLAEGMSLDDSVDFFFSIGPLSRAMADGTDDQRLRVRQALKETFATRETDKGVVFGSASWIVTARNT